MLKHLCSNSQSLNTFCSLKLMRCEMLATVSKTWAQWTHLVSVIEHNHSELMTLVANDVSTHIGQFRMERLLKVSKSNNGRRRRRTKKKSFCKRRKRSRERRESSRARRKRGMGGGVKGGYKILYSPSLNQNQNNFIVIMHTLPYTQRNYDRTSWLYKK